MSTRTMVRDAILSEFQAMKTGGAGRVTDFSISSKWLIDTETKQAATYCVVVTDESRSPQTMQEDVYTLSGVVVVYAHDTTDPRAKLDLMIEDAIDVLRRAFQALKSVVQRAMIEGIQTSEGSTAEGDWPQAAIRWNAVHTRAFVA